MRSECTSNVTAIGRQVSVGDYSWLGDEATYKLDSDSILCLTFKIRGHKDTNDQNSEITFTDKNYFIYTI